MRDVIVIGAGGGGPVVAKELAARGLDVLMLEAGPRHADPRDEWAHLENDANNPVSGYFRFGPGRPRASPPGCARRRRTRSSGRSSGVGGTTLHYYGNCPRAYPACSAATAAPTATPTTARTGSRSPTGDGPVLRVGRGDAAGADRRDGHQGARLAARRRDARACRCSARRTRPRARTGRRRTRSSSPAARPAGPRDPAKLRHPQATGCTFCGYCFQGCYEPRGAPRNLVAKRSTDNSYVPMALTADAWQRGGKAVDADHRRVRHRIDTASEGGTTVARGVTWRDNATGEQHSEEAKVVVLAAAARRTRGCGSNAGLPNPNDWVGRGYTDHHFDWVDRPDARLHGIEQGPRVVRARSTARAAAGSRTSGLPPALQAFSARSRTAAWPATTTTACGIDGRGRRRARPAASAPSCATCCRTASTGCSTCW